MLTMTMTTKIAPAAAVLGMSRLARDIRGWDLLAQLAVNYHITLHREGPVEGLEGGIGSREIGFIDLPKQFTNVTSLEFIYLCFTATPSCWLMPTMRGIPSHPPIFISVTIKCHKTYIV